MSTLAFVRRIQLVHVRCLLARNILHSIWYLVEGYLVFARYFSVRRRKERYWLAQELPVAKVYRLHDIESCYLTLFQRFLTSLSGLHICAMHTVGKKSGKPMTGDIREFPGFRVFARSTTDSRPLVVLEYHAFVSVHRWG